MNWATIDKKLQSILPQDIYSLWIRPLQCKRFETDKIELGAPDRFFCSWVANNYLSDIKTALAESDYAKSEITFLVNTSPENNSFATMQKKQEQLRLPSFHKGYSRVKSLNPRFVFDEFVVGDSNAIAHAACDALANGDTSLGHCIYINAGTGLGKSHLTHAVAHHLINYNPGARLNYLTAKQLTAEMVCNIKANTMEQFKEKYQSSDVLLMEDMQSLTGKAKTQEELAALLDILLETGKKIIFTGSMTPRKIEGLDPGMRSRLSSGLITTISAPDLLTRTKIIGKEAQNYKLTLIDEVTAYLADQLQGDIRRIKSAIVGIKAKASLLKTTPDLDMAKEVLADIIDRHQSLSPEIIRDFIAQQFKVTAQDLQSKTRKKTIAFPRQVSMYLSRKYTEKALADIGKAFNRDHSTVLHSIKVITESIARKSSIRGQIELLSEKLNKTYL